LILIKEKDKGASEICITPTPIDLMKKLRLIWIGFFTFSLLDGCKNEIPVSHTDIINGKDPSVTIDAAEEWFEKVVANTSPKSVRANGASNKKAIWKFAVSRGSKQTGRTVIVPIEYDNQVPIVSLRQGGADKKTPAQHINFAARLVIWKNKSGDFQYRIHQIIPDENYRKKNGNKINKDLSGLVLITDFEDNFIEGFLYESGNMTGKISKADKGGRISTCTPYIVDWYTRVCIDTDCFEPRWTHSEEYYICYESDHGSDGVTPPPTISSPQIITNQYDSQGQYVYQIDSDDPKIDTRLELRCFGQNANSNSIFRVKIYVDQVWPGQRSFNLNSSDSSPGHVYLGLEEYSNGETIVRNIGYYPSEIVHPVSPSSPGEAHTDTRPYDVSLTVEVTWGQFMGIVSALQSTSEAEYNLNSNNCTHFALNACSNNGISLPQTVGNWWGGSGLNPSDLGEDIRAMTLSSNMTRDTDGGYPTSKEGGCP
jgi:hypothetical protein